ncbi:hypothetical protein EDB92DRAFT_1872976 [Lactarius akahatsu]|uniref:Uncharacterized protein n=1 Tax=Lactarius akahatsu TaxID=416441 RepID=A0AAD4Q975_9AGAM|nr:hypothetical protein EDB92DRAFT_1872976 [Lactarius akahatsu]
METRPTTSWGLDQWSRYVFFFCFILFHSLCLAAPLKSSPPRHMYVYGRRVHPSPSPPQDGTRCAVFLKYRFTARKPVAAAFTLHFMGVRHRRSPSRRARFVMTPHRGAITTPP